MKKLLLLLLVLGGFNAVAQKVVPLKDNPDAPYLKYKDLPAFDVVDMRTRDTFSTFNIPKGRPILIIYFAPECDHCKKMLDALLPEMDKLKNVDVYMMTFMPLIALEIFNNGYHLEKYPNIKMVGQDYKMFFPPFYGVSNVPDIVLYDKNKKFVKLWPDNVTMDQILAELK